LAAEGFNTFLKYVGGSYIYKRTKFTVRLKIISLSWTAANKTADELAQQEAAADEGGEEAKEGEEGKEGEEVAKDAQEAQAQMHFLASSRALQRTCVTSRAWPAL